MSSDIKWSLDYSIVYHSLRFDPYLSILESILRRIIDGVAFCVQTLSAFCYSKWELVLFSMNVVYNKSLGKQNDNDGF